MDYTTLSLDEAAAALDDAGRQAQALFAPLDAGELNWKPDVSRWSVAQCLEHLIMTNHAMRRSAGHALDNGQPRSLWQRLPLMPALIGPMMVRSQAPNSTRKFKTMAIAQPASSDIARDVVQRFSKQHADLAAWVSGVDPGAAVRAIMVSPFAGMVTYSVLDGCRLMVAHDHRHLQQASRVTESVGFPRR